MSGEHWSRPQGQSPWLARFRLVQTARRTNRGLRWVDYGRSQGAVALNLENVDVHGDLLGHRQELAIGAERQRGSAGISSAEIGERILIAVRVPSWWETKALHIAGADRIDDVDEISRVAATATGSLPPHGTRSTSAKLEP